MERFWGGVGVIKPRPLCPSRLSIYLAHLPASFANKAVSFWVWAEGRAAPPVYDLARGGRLVAA